MVTNSNAPKNCSKIKNVKTAGASIIAIKCLFLIILLGIFTIPSFIGKTKASNFSGQFGQSKPFTNSLALPPCSNINFATQQTFGTGPFPRSVAVGDLNGDGLLDLVVTNQTNKSISVLKNTGTNSISFATQQTFATGGAPVSVVIGDIDGDGLPDLVIANFNDATVSVLQNTSTNGNISFANQVTFGAGVFPFSVSIGDLDGDGKLDLVTTNIGAAAISVLKNTTSNGTISFTGQGFSTGNRPVSVAIKDLNGDGKLDLAVVNSNDNTVSVLANTSTSGNISFATQVAFATDKGPDSIIASDLDGDGKLDLATANQASNTVSVLKNTGTSGNISFATQVTFSTGSSPGSIIASDLDGDGKLDLTVTNGIDTTVSVLQNSSTSGNISFANQVTFSTGSAPGSVATGDIDGDGKLDLAVTNPSSSTVAILQNVCTNTTTTVSSSINPSGFGQSVTFTATVAPIAPATGTPTGTVQFKDGSTNLGSAVTLSNGSAQFTTSTLTGGSHSITAVYSGDTNFITSTSTAISQVVKKVSVSTLTATPTSSVFGQSVNLSVTVTGAGATPTGTVQFKDGTTNLGSPIMLSNGSASVNVSALSVATHSFTASYSGDSNFNSSTSNIVSLVVSKANTTTSLTASQNQIVVGQMVTFTATISVVSPGAGITPGTVTFKDGATTLGSSSVGNGQAVLTVAINNVGTRTITATYSGDSNFNGSTSNNVNLFVSTVDHNTIYVADTLNNRIQRSTNNGQSWQMVGNGAGLGLGQFNAPKAVTANFMDTVIFVADTGNNRIQRSTDSGLNWQVIVGGLKSTQISQPSGIAYDEINNKLYIADTGNNTILVVTNPTSTSPIISVFAEATAGTAVGKFNQPQAITVDLNGSVYVADTANNRIQVNSNGLNTGWTVLIAGGKTGNQILVPKGVYVDNNGRIWVADTGNNRIQVNTNGTWSVFMSAGTTAGTVSSPEGVVVTLSGNVFIADTGNNRIQSKAATGGTATVVGQAGTAIGQFSQPSGIR